MEAITDPRLTKRRGAIVAAARELFVERGFEKTSLADVVALAGGSLATLYKLFGNKAGLLTAVVLERAQSGEAMISEIGSEDLTPREALKKLGERLRAKFIDPEGVAISRIVIAYSLQDPDFASRFHRKTMVRSQEALARLFTKWEEQGHTLSASPEALSSIFLGMFIHELHSDAISQGTLSPLEFRDLDAKIDFFCRGAGIRH